MKTPLVLNRSSDWLIPGSPSDSRLFHADEADQIRVCSSHIGQGYFQVIPLQDDLDLAIHDYTLNQIRVIDRPGGVNCLEFEFRLTGSDAGYSSFVPYFGLREFGIEPAQKHSLKVEVWFKRPTLITYCQALMERLSPQAQGTAERILQLISRYKVGGSGSTSVGMLNQIFDGAKTPGPQLALTQILTDALYAETSALNNASRRPLTPDMEQVIGQILSCPYQGATRRTYLKRQALTLVELYLEAIAQRHRQETNLDYVDQAGSILRTQMAHPPTVEALARQVGTNRRKLTEGFHQLYGTTPFRYLRDCRLAQAKRLLMLSDLSVGEVAAAVGYTSGNRFGKAFCQKIGLNPKAFQMQV